MTEQSSTVQHEVLDWSAGGLLRQVGLSMGSIFGQGHCWSSEVWGRVAGWKQLGRTAGLVPCPSAAIDWALQWPGFLRHAY